MSGMVSQISSPNEQIGIEWLRKRIGVGDVK
jgi:hypothetical protein